MEPSVVVEIKCKVFEHANDGVIAVRFAPFGLTAYGNTKEEAIDEFKKLLNRFITAYREKGNLEEVLGRSAVKWAWEKDYTREYEHTGAQSSVPTPAAKPLGMIDVYQREWLERLVGSPEREFAVAA